MIWFDWKHIVVSYYCKLIGFVWTQIEGNRIYFFHSFFSDFSWLFVFCYVFMWTFKEKWFFLPLPSSSSPFSFSYSPLDSSTVISLSFSLSGYFVFSNDFFLACQSPRSEVQSVGRLVSLMHHFNSKTHMDNIRDDRVKKKTNMDKDWKDMNGKTKFREKIKHKNKREVTFHIK